MHKHNLRLTSSIGHRLTDVRTMVAALSGIYSAGTLVRPHTPSRELFEQMAVHIKDATERDSEVVDFMHSADRLGLYGKMVETLNRKLGKNSKTTAAVIYGEKFGLMDKDKLRVLMSGDASSLDLPLLLTGIKDKVPNFDLDRPSRPAAAPNSPKGGPTGP